ncbi:hypothetical protein ACFFIY_05330 [Bhargavaea ullalensis]|uniref:Phycobilisome protein n=1 Tax=Bhargavaea ullalensis TaxID=1265685 RepID=A0ABV2GEN5_9BACL
MNAEQFVDRVTDEIYARDPALLERFGEQGKVKCREDNHHHLRHLRTAYELNNAAFFTDYAVWLGGILTRHGMNTRHLLDNFQIIEDLLEQEPEDLETVRYREYLAKACVRLKEESEKGGI